MSRRTLLLMVLFTHVACETGPYDFDRPTDVAVAADGSFYVTDGYGNCRVLHFSAAGELLSQWGECGSGPGELDLPHGIALSPQGQVYIADRRNARLQVFEGDGTWVRELTGPDVGRPYGLDIDAQGFVYVVDGGDQTEGEGRNGIMRFDAKGLLLNRWGGFGDSPGQTRLAHDIAVHPEGSVFVADAEGNRLIKFRSVNAP